MCLYSDDGQQALATFQDCISIPSFASSEEGRAAVSLIDAYRQDSEDAIRETITKYACFKFLEPSVGRLAMKLPKSSSNEICQALNFESNPFDDGDDLDDDLT